jgi:hypothetical protein
MTNLRNKIKDSIRRNVGHRGAFLLFLALLDILYGYSLVVVPRVPYHFYLNLHISTWPEVKRKKDVVSDDQDIQ